MSFWKKCCWIFLSCYSLELDGQSCIESYELKTNIVKYIVHKKNTIPANRAGSMIIKKTAKSLYFNSIKYIYIYMIKKFRNTIPYNSITISRFLHFKNIFLDLYSLTLINCIDIYDKLYSLKNNNKKIRLKRQGIKGFSYF